MSWRELTQVGCSPDASRSGTRSRLYRVSPDPVWLAQRISSLPTARFQAVACAEREVFADRFLPELVMSVDNRIHPSGQGSVTTVDQAQTCHASFDSRSTPCTRTAARRHRLGCGWRSPEASDSARGVRLCPCYGARLVVFSMRGRNCDSGSCLCNRRPSPSPLADWCANPACVQSHLAARHAASPGRTFGVRWRYAHAILWRRNADGTESAS